MKLLHLKNLIFVVFCGMFMQAMAAAPQNVFDIWEYQIAGNSLLDQAEIESLLYPYLGPGQNLQVIETARDRLQVLYKQKGYPIVVVSIPEQNVVAGVVKLQVIEGVIDRVKITGNEYFSRRELREELPSLTAGSPLAMNSVRAEVDEANRLNPYRSILPVIRPGRYPGTMELELKVRDRLPLHASVETNNRYTSSTSHSRLSAAVGYDNLFQRHHSLTLGYQTSPQQPDEVNVYNITYSLPASSESRMVIYAVRSDSNVATVTAEGDTLDVLGNGRIAGLRNIFSQRSGSQYFQSVSLGADYKDFGETQQLSNAQHTNDFNVPINYINWSLSYSAASRQAMSSTQFSLVNNFGLRGIANQQAEFENKRSLAIPNYFYLQASVAQNFNFLPELAASYVLRGQYTQTPLISNEQISAGGVDSVRGYLESSALGDNGLLASVELNYLPFADKPPAHLQAFNLSVFTQAAHLRVIDALPNANNEINDRTKLWSAGVGMELQAFDGMRIKLYFARPLYKLNQDGFDNAAKLHFNLSYDF